MKQIKSIIYVLAASALAAGCSRNDFANINTNPDAVLTIAPETELTTGQLAVYNNSFEAFYDYYHYIRPWTQEFVPTAGNAAGAGAFISVANGDQRWSTFYNNCGPDFVDVQQLITKMAAAGQARYADLYAIDGINLVEYAFYNSDPNGSMPYTQAFQARYSDNLTPTWNTQEDLFDTLDNQLQTYIKTLETTQSVAQDTGGANELIYSGSVNEWIKAANSLRLRMAMRLMKQNPSKLTSIANAILADPVGLMTSNADDWTFITGPGLFGDGGNSNYNPIGDGQTNESMERNVVNFMINTGDPRLSAELQPATISTQAEFDSAQVAGQIPAGVTFDGQTYRGQYASPDSAKVNSRAWQFATLTFSYNNVIQQVPWVSIISPYMMYSEYNNGQGVNVVPVITFADDCFMRAELVLRGLDDDGLSAQQLYTMGVTASLEDYDQWATLAQVPGYTPLGGNTISNYLAAPGVAWQAANGLEQVLVQEYLHDYMNPNEAWALIKRTGYPSSTGVILPLENMTSGGTPVVMPRRFPTQYPNPGDLDYNNDLSAINAELAQPGYGTANQITGMVWWDQ